MKPAEAERLRIDKWLWAARFFKTRSLAAQAVEGGKVRLNEVRVKPAKELRIGDVLRIQIGETEWSVKVLGLAAQRRSAPEAQALYEESEESKKQREERAAARKQFLDPYRTDAGRPTKKDRRMIRRFTGE